MKYLVNIRGCNGSGKSTIPMSMMDDPDMYVVEKPYKGKMKKILTVFPNYQWVALGSYFNKTGGLDTLPDTNITIKTLWYALKKYPKYHILMEGVLSSTVFSTYEKLFNEVMQEYQDRHIVIVHLNPPLEVCLERIYKRNGGKPIKEKLVSDKVGMVSRSVAKFEKAGFDCIHWDNSDSYQEDVPMIEVMMNLIKRRKKSC